MPEFTFLYRGRETNLSPEQLQKTVEKWTVWFKELDAKGHIRDIGQPLEPTGKVITGKHKTVIDGPFAEVKDMVGGFTVIEARDLEEAVHLSKDCPILEVGGSVEVRPVQKYNM